MATRISNIVFLIAFLFPTFAWSNDSSLNVLQKKVKILIDKDNNKEALNLLDSCFKLDAKNAINYNLKAMAYLGSSYINDDKNNAIAIQLLKKAIVIDSINGDYYANLGNCYCNINDNKNSLFFFKKALRQNPSNLKYNQNLLRILWVMNKNKEAFAFSNELIKLFPNDGYAYYVRGQLKRDYIHKYVEGNKDIKRSEELGWEQGVEYFY